MIQNLSIIPQLIVFDFDGVMTDNRVLVNEKGEEAVFVSRADGLGIQLIKNLSIPMIILSTERNSVVNKRAEKLNLECLNGIEDKKNALFEYCNKKDINIDNVLYVGNDMNDYDVMQSVGIRVSPADAFWKIKKISNIILDTNGGYGVVRELADYLVKLNEEKINGTKRN